MIKFSDIVATSKQPEKVIWSNPPQVPDLGDNAALARELFPTTVKSWAIYQNNYQYITIDQMKQYLEGLNNFFVSEQAVHQLSSERFNNLTRTGTMFPVKDRLGMTTGWETYKFSTFGLSMPDEDKNMWVRDIVQNGVDVYDVQILKIPTKEYSGIVPAHVVETAIKHHDKFDEIAVLEPKITKLAPAPELMDDPILVGFMHAFPDRVFLLDYWKENVSVDMIAQQAQINFGGEENNPLRLG